VNYTVHTDPGLPWNTVIANRAAIFFDFNEAVITNYTINTICEPLSISSIPDVTVSVYPNPAKDAARFTVSGNEDEWTLRVYDICGKLVLNEEITGNQSADIRFRESMKGLYLYEVKSGAKTAFGKIVIE